MSIQAFPGSIRPVSRVRPSGMADSRVILAELRCIFMRSRIRRHGIWMARDAFRSYQLISLFPRRSWWMRQRREMKAGQREEKKETLFAAGYFRRGKRY
ncbi:hypothetical protein CEXT_336121 [Caerostris extrusa]|uniref:Uncharacterized protein n=1 Tax=Caerostris extrusa TaxID=172846 RepID=A0AAV4S2V5_CAEEX|nr:hypothetical protein CEXT_336121 [Caerostris extrusa]